MCRCDICIRVYPSIIRQTDGHPSDILLPFHCFPSLPPNQKKKEKWGSPSWRVDQSSSLNILLKVPNFFFFRALPCAPSPLISTSARPVAVNRRVPISGLFPFVISPPITPSAVSAVKGLPSSPPAIFGRFAGTGNGQALLFSLLGPLRFCNLGVEGRSPRKAARSDLLRSRGVSRRAGDSASDFLTFEEGSGFLRRRIDMKLPRRE